MPNLSQKERTLLEDEKSHEELCIKKYGKYASLAQDQELKNLFTQLEQQERQHLDTINQILGGQVPQMQQGQSQSGGQSSGMNMMGGSQGSSMNMSGQSWKSQPNMGKGAMEADMDLCQDMLATEKYVSSTYDTAIFEFRDKNIRNALNHIQKEEQEHGEAIFKYMNSKGGYQV
jgi:spore coat protein CotF